MAIKQRQEVNEGSVLVQGVLFLFISVIILGNIVEYRRINLISLTADQHSNKHYGSMELHEIRSHVNKLPKLKELPASVIRRIRASKIK